MFLKKKMKTKVPKVSSTFNAFHVAARHYCLIVVMFSKTDVLKVKTDMDASVFLHECHAEGMFSKAEVTVVWHGAKEQACTC